MNRCLTAWLVSWMLSGQAAADPVVAPPPIGKGALTEHEDGEVALAFIGEIGMLAILGTEPLTTYPQVENISGDEPELANARVGLLRPTHPGVTVGFSIRVDLSEGLRVTGDEFSDHPAAAVTRFIDDAAVLWTPRVWASVAAGRFKVPFSRFRQVERSNLSSGAVPFLIDRAAPDRRWGATLFGDLGALAYAAGGYADIDAIEPRRASEPQIGTPTDDPDPSTGDPSAGGRAMAALYVGWTPRAPIGADHLATPSSDPWFHTVRPAAGVGVLWRYRAGGGRLDLSLNGQLKYRRLAAIGELIAYADSGQIGLSAAGEASILMTDRVITYVRADYDAEVDLWSAGAGTGFFATSDRRSRIGIFGWLRRDTNRGPKRHGVVVELQAAL